jgi:hypothetical protein
MVYGLPKGGVIIGVGWGDLMLPDADGKTSDGVYVKKMGFCTGRVKRCRAGAAES